ncbi:hypothetical protein KSMBR1_0337 [Candidatus Kuenenia stuttgartiensis]|jgi:hypothetical protein|uniref:Uncharacterized protein n=1 Tax=Kuenenia stuttgartiensis TaxID=174633 RepID=A0A2C9CBB1_KUEST|nr:hypothetical protein KSMBR1_0337 [Candidatus Kuenenia stuttgartiensis]
MKMGLDAKGKHSVYKRRLLIPIFVIKWKQELPGHVRSQVGTWEREWS